MRRGVNRGGEPPPFALSLSKGPIILSLSKDLSLSKGRTELGEGPARAGHNPSTDGPSTSSVPAQGERMQAAALGFFAAWAIATALGAWLSASRAASAS